MTKKKTFSSPDSSEREYTRDLLKLTQFLKSDVNRLLIPRLGAIQSEFKVDAWTDTLDAIMIALGQLAQQAVFFTLTKLPGRFEAVSKFNEAQFKMVVKANTGLELPPVMPGAPSSAILGVSAFRSEPYLIPLAEGWIADNTKLIKSLPTSLHTDLEGIIRRGVMSGDSVKTLKEKIMAKYDVADNRAKLIAQDQTLKLHSNLTRYRLQSVGVKDFIWRTVGDSRVRVEHADLNGERFSFSKPPEIGLPGQPVRCRCRAEGIWPQ